MAKIKKVIINTRVKPKTKEKIDELAEKNESTPSEIVRLILERYFEERL